MRGSQIADHFDPEADHPITPRMINALIKYGYTNKDFVYPEFTTEENEMEDDIGVAPTQNQEVWAWLEDHGTITDNEARDHLYINRLAARVYDLRKDGYPIEKIMITVKRPNRRSVSFAKYFIKNN